jgi:hypothetical protein
VLGWTNIGRQSIHFVRWGRKKKDGRPALEFKDVLAALMSVVRSFKSIGVDISLRNSTAFVEALRKDSAMIVGWIPF